MSVTAIPKLPYKPVKPYIPSVKRARAMTIAAAFECNDGFVFCADRLMTHGKASDFGSFAHYGKKVFPLDDIGFAAAVCGSGDSLLISAVSEEIIKHLYASEGKPKDIQETQSVLETILQDVTTRVGTIPDLSLLLGVVTNKDSRFIRSDGLIIQAANHTEILGIGETSLARYLIDSVYHWKIGLNELAALAAFIVFGAKKYCPQYCGGQTDISILHKNRFWEDVAISDKKVSELEGLIAGKAPQQLQDLIHDAAELLK
jgi:20S proteasome alpha/beta subunit